MQYNLIKENLKTKYRLIAIIISIFFGIFIFGSIVSFNHEDPSFNKISSGSLGVINNAFSWVGAYFSDPILQFFGLTTLLFSFCIFIFSLLLIFTDRRYSFILKTIALILLMLSTSLLLSLKPAPEDWPFYVGHGGFVGDYINKLYINEQNRVLYSLLLPLLVFALALFCMGVKYIDIKSFFEFVKNTNEKTQEIYSSLTKEEKLEGPRFTLKTKPILPSKDNTLEANSGKTIAEKTPPEKPKKKEKKFKLPLINNKKVENYLVADDFQVPDVDLLTNPSARDKQSYNESQLQEIGVFLMQVLEDFGIKGEIVNVRPGPVVTLYELVPAAGTKSSRVIGLSDDIARSMSSISARISVIPGRNALGIELPNDNRETVYLRELIESKDYQDEKYKLPIALGKNIGGESVMADLSRMPHLLIAGTTGSGKSVAVNAMILSYLYRLTPDECKFIMIDPKMLELSVYEGIPHLLSPVVTDPKKAVVALKWAVREMEDRYRLMSNLGVRNVHGFNQKIVDAIENDITLERTVQTGFDPETGEPTFERQAIEKKKLPFIVVIVDEMADLMLTAGKDIESSIQRLAQMARAAGIHMVMATQRPSVDVITGVIKANFPTRISFQVTSRIDSRTILGEMGAEQLLGMGDMLYMSGGGRVMRVHGPFVDDKEVELVVEHLKQQGTPAYVDDITKEDSLSEEAAGVNSGDELYDQAVSIIIRDKKVSTSYIQRQLKIGYNRAANLIDKMENEGIISEANHAGKRQILID